MLIYFKRNEDNSINYTNNHITARGIGCFESKDISSIEDDITIVNSKCFFTSELTEEHLNILAENDFIKYVSEFLISKKHNTELLVCETQTLYISNFIPEGYKYSSNSFDYHNVIFCIEDDGVYKKYKTLSDANMVAKFVKINVDWDNRDLIINITVPETMSTHGSGNLTPNKWKLMVVTYFYFVKNMEA